MRLLITTDTVGGVWTYTTELTRALLRKGAAVAMAVIGRPSCLQQQWLDQASAEWGNHFRWDACAADLEWMSNNDGAFHHAAPLLLRVADDFRAELLHSNQFCFGALPLTIPRLVVAHSDVLSWATACRGQAIEPSPWLDTYQHLAGKGLREASAVVAPTRWMLDALRKHFDVPAQAHIIPNGRTLPPVPAKGSARKLQAVSAGRLWDEAKNLAILHHVQAPFPILVAGDLEYQSQTATVLPVDVCMLGHLAEDELLRLFAQSALYLCTSLYEPFGLAPLEAALCGCAVLANDIPSLREVWGGGATYFKDACSLQARLTEFAREPQTLAAAQHRSFLRARRYTAARMAARYLDVYQAMLRKPERTAHVA